MAAVGVASRILSATIATWSRSIPVTATRMGCMLLGICCRNNSRKTDSLTYCVSVTRVLMCLRSCEGFRVPNSCPDRSCFSFWVSVSVVLLKISAFNLLYGASASGLSMRSATSPARSGPSAATTWLNFVSSFVILGVARLNLASTMANQSSGLCVQHGGSVSCEAATWGSFASLPPGILALLDVGVITSGSPIFTLPTLPRGSQFHNLQ
jgi:hypothetical protein